MRKFRVVPEYTALGIKFSVEEKKFFFGWLWKDGFFNTKEEAENFIKLLEEVK